MAIMKTHILRVACAAAILVCPTLSQAAIVWNVTYQDDVDAVGVGFNAGGGLGAARKATFNSVLNYINTVVNHNGTVDIAIQSSQTDGTGFLASAGAFHFPTDGFSSGFVHQHATTGTDPSGTFPDANVTFDFGYIWNSETDATAGGEFDMFTVALHEVTHTMGFASLIGADGSSRLTEPAGVNTYTTYDSFLQDAAGNPLITGADPEFVPGELNELTTGEVFFNGANAMAANGGNPVELNTPNLFAAGSSISHLDPAFSNSLMLPSIGLGDERRTYSAIERAMLADLGWTVNAVPEPSGVLLLFAMTLAGATIRRRRPLFT